MIAEIVVNYLQLEICFVFNFTDVINLKILVVKNPLLIDDANMLFERKIPDLENSLKNLTNLDSPLVCSFINLM